MDPTLEPLPLAPPGPPVAASSPRAWVKENLFPNRLNAVVTVVFGGSLGLLLFRALRFVLASAEWEIVRRNLTLFMLGRFPRDELWRPWAGIAMLVIGIGVSSGMLFVVRRHAASEAGLPVPRPPTMGELIRRSWPLVTGVAVILSFAQTLNPVLYVLAACGLGIGARALGLRAPVWLAQRRTAILVIAFLVAVQLVVRFDGVGWDDWGGLMLTLFLAFGGIVLSFPIGLLLALGRRSRMPVVRALSVGYIELIRGVPLVTLLFMGAFALGFFFPAGFRTPSDVTRALIVITAFTAAYMAEIVRGGLQSVPTGQVEAAQALGLSQQKTQRLIVLPQALRAVIPAIVGQFISLFKDTSLVVIVGLTDLLRVSAIANSQPEFVGRGLAAETLAFTSFVYWSVAFWMSRASQRLERRLGVGER
jgi:general L-amino acid transport system permease protein